MCCQSAGTILTTAANAVLAPIHDRMPVIVPSGEYDRWLDTTLTDPDLLAPLLVPFSPEEMLAFPVSPRVNTPATDDMGCIAPSNGSGKPPELAEGYYAVDSTKAFGLPIKKAAA